MHFTVKSGSMKELKFGGCITFVLYFWKRCSDELILLGKLVDPGFVYNEAYFKLYPVGLF